MKEKITPDIKNKKGKKPQGEKIPVVEEKLSVGKKEVETGRVKITKKVMEQEVPLDFTAYEEEIEIDVKEIERVVEKPGKAVRKEGETTIYSVYREEYVKQTILEKEVWVTQKRHQKNLDKSEKLKREVIEIERTPKKLKKDQ